jgi:hypothetical protein
MKLLQEEKNKFASSALEREEQHFKRRLRSVCLYPYSILLRLKSC